MITKNKKGVSEIVSYTLLIIIAVALSVLVYNFILGYIPKGEVAECPEGTSIIIAAVNCTQNTALVNISELKLINKGLWNITSVYLRVGKVGTRVKSSIGSSVPYLFVPPLAPGATVLLKSIIVDSTIITQDLDKYELEAQPAIFSEETKKRIVCKNAVITQSFNCPVLW